MRTPNIIISELQRAQRALMNASPDSRTFRALKIRVQALTLELALIQPSALSVGAL